MANLEKIQKYLNWRHEFLTEEAEKHGGELECVYCGMKSLELGYKTLPLANNNNKITNLATVDHIIPGIRGDARMNKDISVVSCKSCNNNKKDVDPMTLPPPKFGNCKEVDKWKREYFMDMTPCDENCDHAHPKIGVETKVRYCKLLKKRLQTVEEVTLKLECDE